MIVDFDDKNLHVVLEAETTREAFVLGRLHAKLKENSICVHHEDTDDAVTVMIDTVLDRKPGYVPDPNHVDV